MLENRKDGIGLIMEGLHRVSESSDKKYTLFDLQKAPYSSSFMGDREVIPVGTRGEYIKIGKDKWQYSPYQGRALGGIYTDMQVYDLLSKEGITEAFCYEDYFESMKNEPSMDDMETTNESWLYDEQILNEAKMVTPNGKMYPKDNVGVILAGGAGLN